MRPPVLLLSALALASSGCKTITPSLPTIERQPPKDCLKIPAIKPYKLPDWFVKATPEDQAALMLNAKAVDMAALKERDAMLADCRAWHRLK